MDEFFSVVGFFADGAGHEYMRVHLNAVDAVRTAHRYALSPAADAGVLERVMIVDARDYAVFEWVRGQGVTWPLEMAGGQ